MFTPYFTNKIKGLNNEGETLKSGPQKLSYAYGLFKDHYWYLNTKKISPFVEGAKDFEQTSSFENKNTANENIAVNKTTMASALKAFKRIDDKEVNLNELPVDIHADKSHDQRPLLKETFIERKHKSESAKQNENFEVSEVNLESSIESYFEKLNPDWKIKDIPGINHFNERVKVIFFGLSEVDLSDLSSLPMAPLSLLKSDQDLLGKMINAINLEEGTFLRCPVFRSHIDKSDKFALDNFLNIVNYFRPQAIVSLGANATNILIQKRLKLSNCHGEIQAKAFKNSQTGETLNLSVFPLFHPDLLEINQSMKRTTWIDLQRLSKLLN